VRQNPWFSAEADVHGDDGLWLVVSSQICLREVACVRSCMDVDKRRGLLLLLLGIYWSVRVCVSNLVKCTETDGGKVFLVLVLADAVVGRVRCLVCRMVIDAHVDRRMNLCAKVLIDVTSIDRSVVKSPWVNVSGTGLFKRL